MVVGERGTQEIEVVMMKMMKMKKGDNDYQNYDVQFEHHLLSNTLGIDSSSTRPRLSWKFSNTTPESKQVGYQVGEGLAGIEFEVKGGNTGGGRETLWTRQSF